MLLAKERSVRLRAWRLSYLHSTMTQLRVNHLSETRLPFLASSNIELVSNFSNLHLIWQLCDSTDKIYGIVSVGYWLWLLTVIKLARPMWSLWLRPWSAMVFNSSATGQLGAPDVNSTDNNHIWKKCWSRIPTRVHPHLPGHTLNQYSTRLAAQKARTSSWGHHRRRVHYTVWRTASDYLLHKACYQDWWVSQILYDGVGVAISVGSSSYPWVSMN